jgi:hypothetical protein
MKLYVEYERYLDGFTEKEIEMARAILEHCDGSYSEDDLSRFVLEKGKEMTRQERANVKELIVKLHQATH